MGVPGSPSFMVFFRSSSSASASVLFKLLYLNITFWLMWDLPVKSRGLIGSPSGVTGFPSPLNPWQVMQLMV